MLNLKTKVVVLGLFVAVGLISIFSLPDKNLHVIACDVGQGDAILLVNGANQILIDGGPDNSVLNCLGRHMPFWDRKIEMVVLTHPQSDHFTGLIEVFRRYQVDVYLANATDNLGNEGYQVLKKEVGSRGVKAVGPYAGQQMRLGLIYLDILNPTGGFESKNLNDWSVVAELRFGSFRAFFTGDIEGSMDVKLLEQLALSEVERVDYLKVNHHGSKNGLTNELLEVLRPKVAVISAGKNNHYGHPHQEILEMLKDANAKILRTDQLGDVEIISDGKSYWVK